MSGRAVVRLSPLLPSDRKRRFGRKVGHPVDTVNQFFSSVESPLSASDIDQKSTNGFPPCPAPSPNRFQPILLDARPQYRNFCLIKNSDHCYVLFLKITFLNIFLLSVWIEYSNKIHNFSCFIQICCWKVEIFYYYLNFWLKNYCCLLVFGGI